jgi:signal transduction histidine kinase/ActR/RegA family two-component response regulator
MEITETLLANLDQLGNWGILTTDKDLKIVGWNRWLEKHSGKPASELLGQHLLNAYPDLVVRSLDRYFHQALAGQAAILSQRFHKYLLPLPPTGNSSTLMQMQQTVRISPVMDGDRVCGTLTLIEDVTERVLTEQELRLQAERLEEANRHKDEFLAMLAHELRNPLAPIRNGVRVLDVVKADSEEAQQTRAMIERQVAHMSRLIDDLLDVSRIVRGKVRLQTDTCDLIALLRQVAQDFQPILDDNGLQLLVELPAEPCWLQGDAIRLAQIVTNLLQNANKFTNRGGEVRLAANVRPDEQVVLVAVSDNGIGMSADTIARVFDAFTQAESTLARSKGGLGLGLALVKGLAELHNGKVEAFSKGVGQGSTFTVRLPTHKPGPSNQATRALPPVVSRAVKRVLIIEDNRDTAISLKMLLRHLGFEVDIAFSGSEGIDVARRMSPDVILCDIGLPGLDGYAVARALRNDAVTREAFLIAQSGYGQADDVRKAHEAGFDVHLIKPVDFQELRRILQSHQFEFAGE